MSALSELVNNMQSSSSADKGSLFEDICLYFLMHDKFCRSRFSHVWKWQDFPLNDGRPDTGIDIAAKIRGTDTYCAVQCKFRTDTSPITKAEIDSFLAASSKPPYSERLIISTNNNYGRNALDTLKGQVPPVKTLTLHDMERSIDWTAYPDNVRYITKTLRPDQIHAVESVIQGFNANDRGKLIMACGTGKTFTSLKIAERFSGAGSVVLFLVPSIALLNQSLLAWNNDAPDNLPLISFAVCSDKTVGKNLYPDEDLKLSDLSCPPTTNADELLTAWRKLPDNSKAEAVTVIFSTYQSSQVIHDAQAQGFPDFSLMICDEAHRTAGLDSGSFTQIHDDAFIRARKRLYMTATPKIYADSVKTKAKNSSTTLCSMDNQDIYGPEFFRLSFSQAVDAGLLSDYKVMIFMVDKNEVSRILISEDKSIPISEAAKIYGCRDALAKNLSPEDYSFIQLDPEPMKSAVAFTGKIKDSQEFAELFAPTIAAAAPDNPLTCEVRHVDGTMSAHQRANSVQWLADTSPDTCRILSNARCLSEGVDVPALDAVIFLSPKKSEIDIVQSIGRVMRKAPGKNFGYVIIPVAVSSELSPDEALNSNKEYQAVWKVLQALRSHDDTFNAVISSLDLNGRHPKIIVVPPKRKGNYSRQLELQFLNDWEKALNIRIIQKCGDREYWDKWVHDLAAASQRHSSALQHLIDTNPDAKPAFTEFADGLRETISPAVTDTEAVNMLAQHIVSKRVFDELFAGFSRFNPVSQAMQGFLDGLKDYTPASPELENFYAHVHTAVREARTDAAKQRLIRSIYERFFRFAFTETAERLGIVYTPEEIVDFILMSADWAARHELGLPQGLGTQNVHILDPFSGTGTFTARLIHLGLIPDDMLGYKYSGEIHANEILLLAYYISAINIEASFHQRDGGSYKPFPGMVLTDTFRLNREKTLPLDPVFFENGERANRQERRHINVIIGNPPYNVGGGKIYRELDGRISDTYAKKGTAKFKGSLYDSYIRAIRWASDRIENDGIICFVTNGSFIDANSADGLRKCLAEEFSAVYIFNLRGNQRGGDWRKEGGKVFGEGSQLPIAVTMLVKSSACRQARIYYYAVGDYMKREEKLAELVRLGDFGRMTESGVMAEVVPNGFGDWVNQRSGIYEEFMNLGSRNEPDRFAVFDDRYSAGVHTGHDAYSYNFSRDELCRNIKRRYHNAVISDDTVRVGLYRPYVKMYLHFSRDTTMRLCQIPAIFPKHDTKNKVIFITGIGAGRKFSVLMTNCVPNLHLMDTGQCFPLYWYEGGVRYDGISDDALVKFRRHYGDEAVTKEDIFSYIYGVLSSREYGERFGNDTRRVLARVPFARDFWAFSRAGRELGELHTGYESVSPYPVELCGDAGDLRVSGMRSVIEGGERVIRYNDGLTVRGIPESAWEYEVNGRSALEWVIERYSDSCDKASGLRNDCNDWGREHGNERYVLELIGRVAAVSVRTVEILRGMPELGV